MISSILIFTLLISQIFASTPAPSPSPVFPGRTLESCVTSEECSSGRLCLESPDMLAEACPESGSSCVCVPRNGFRTCRDIRGCPRGEVCARELGGTVDICASRKVVSNDETLEKLSPRIVMRQVPRVCLGAKVRVPKSDPSVNGDRLRLRCCRRFRIGCRKQGARCARMNQRGQRVQCDRRLKCVIDRFATVITGRCMRIRGRIPGCSRKTCKMGDTTVCRRMGDVTTCGAVENLTMVEE